MLGFSVPVQNQSGVFCLAVWRFLFPRRVGPTGDTFPKMRIYCPCNAKIAHPDAEFAAQQNPKAIGDRGSTDTAPGVSPRMFKSGDSHMANMMMGTGTSEKSQS